MPVTPTYPGVYIEEIPSGVRTISGVATSIAAFIDFFKRGPVNNAVQILSMADFEREFGGLDARSEASYAIPQFFLNGGTEAWVVRTASGTFAKASAVIMNAVTAGGTALTVEAANEGRWGNSLRVRIDYQTAIPASDFNLLVSEYALVGGVQRVVRSELFRNLTMDSTKSNFVQRVVNEGSKLISVSPGTGLPVQNGTVSGDLSVFPLPAAFPIANPSLNITVGSDGPFAVVLTKKPADLRESRSLLEAAIRAAKPDLPAFADATVQIHQNRLWILAGPGAPRATVVFAAATVPPAPLADAGTVAALKLDVASGASINVQEYTLGYHAGLGPRIAALNNTGAEGADGDPPNATALIGDLSAKTGLYAFEDVDLFNILCLPRTAMVTGSNPLTAIQARTVLSTAIAYCEKRRAFLVMDTPTNIASVQKAKEWLEDNATLRHKNAAFYFPRVQIADPLDDFRLRSIGGSGLLAGLYARTDAQRGVWKAPAGTEAVLRNVQALDYTMTDPENGTLNPLAINCLRNFPIYGNVCWGARTLDGADQQASEWKYIPVRRLALFIEESLYRGTKWVVFEPNDEPLWAQIRLNIGAFMHTLFRQGAFQGQTPREAYFVKCDKETTTQTDINLGIVNIVVGFAPLKPAEFVIIKIQQMAGQIQT